MNYWNGFKKSGKMLLLAKGAKNLLLTVLMHLHLLILTKCMMKSMKPWLTQVLLRN